MIILKISFETLRRHKKHQQIQLVSTIILFQNNNIESIIFKSRWEAEAEVTDGSVRENKDKIIREDLLDEERTGRGRGAERLKEK